MLFPHASQVLTAEFHLLTLGHDGRQVVVLGVKVLQINFQGGNRPQGEMAMASAARPAGRPVCSMGICFKGN